MIERDGAVAGVRLADGEMLPGGSAVVAAGAWSERLGCIPPLSIRSRARSCVSTTRPDPGCCPVSCGSRPRTSSRAAMGVTSSARRWRSVASTRTVTAGAVFELLRDAGELLPGIAELVIEKLVAGLRPGTADNAPLIGPGRVAGLLWATGHYRHGVLLAPITARSDRFTARRRAAHRGPLAVRTRAGRGSDAVAAGALR